MTSPALGLGCASMGSRKSVRASGDALRRAYAAGVRWFDVAPSYGDGAAEAVLGEFARSNPPGITICTKAGILPGHVSPLKRVLRPALRFAIEIAPGLRAAVKARRPAAMKQPLSAGLIHQSVDASLTRLGVERIDVLALHDATPAEVADPAIIAALDALWTAGKVQRFSIASSPEAALAGLRASPIYTFVQVANNPLERGVERLRAGGALPSEPQIVTHSVFGAQGIADIIARQIDTRAEVAIAMNEGGYAGTSRQKAQAFLADFAFAESGVDVVLMSMFDPHHLESNMARLLKMRDGAAIARIAALVSRPDDVDAADA
ncbi:MAG: aldo/keto reductase [Sphingomonas sp.]